MKITRRDLLITLGAAAGATLARGFPAGLDSRAPLPADAADAGVAPPSRPVTAITLGAGNRGNVYGGFAVANPAELHIVGVAEPIALRNERYAKLHAIPAQNRFTTWEQVFDRPKFADAVIITTPDNLHYAPCLAALKAGYDILLEKPIAPTEKECRDIRAAVKSSDRIVGICHVLRYAPYFVKLRELVDAGAIGEVVSIQHMEPISYKHMAHSYVRGNWHNRGQTTPIILAKSCHDLDILRWMVGRPCQRIVAMGSLKWFRQENAPPGSTARCADGCAVEATCPYSALKLYHQNTNWRYVFDLPDDKSLHDAAVLELLKTTNYGRCVYRMDNDQDDHYVSTMEFANGVTAAFSMEAFTSYTGRRTRIMGSMGDIVGDMTNFTLTDFRTGKATVYDTSTLAAVGGVHGGGDHRLAHDWVRAVAHRDPTILTSTIDASIESHLMGFAAERSRQTGRIENVAT